MPHLAFNEMWHQLYNYLRHSRTTDDWTIQSFLEGLQQRAKASRIEGDFGWAVKWSIERFKGATDESNSQLIQPRHTMH